MRTIVQALWAAGFSIIMACFALQAHAQDAAPTAEELAAEIQAIKQEYEARIQALEGQLEAMTTAPTAQPAVSPMGRKAATADNVFNPAIGMVLDSRFSTHSADHDFAPAGFQVGHAGYRPPEGISLGHPEFTLSGNVDDKFSAAATIALEVPPGGAPELELEEFYVQTLPGAGLPDGARIKAGRALWTFGYLNEIHVHADDFSDRPLPYRAFFVHAFNDDGAEVSYVLPTDIYAEVGGGLFRGEVAPFSGSDDGRNAFSAYGRIGGDVGNVAWRIGAYMMAGEAHDRGAGHSHNGEGGHDDHADDHADEHAHEDDHDDDHADEHAHEDDHDDDHADEHAHEDDHDAHDDDHDEAHHDDHGERYDHIDAFVDGMFSGDVTLYAVDARVTWAPTGNPREQELILQGELFWRVEDGSYTVDEHTTPSFSDSTSMGYYVQGVYKLNRNFRVGARYSRLDPPDNDFLELDHGAHAYAVMADWTNSEFSRFRLQYNREEVEKFVHDADLPPSSWVFVEQDDQILFQYIMSLGAHAAHTF